MKGQTWTGLLTLLAEERVAAELQTRRMADSVSLIKALGGGWLFAEQPPPAGSSEGNLRTRRRSPETRVTRRF